MDFSSLWMGHHVKLGETDFRSGRRSRRGRRGRRGADGVGDRRGRSVDVGPQLEVLQFAKNEGRQHQRRIALSITTCITFVEEILLFSQTGLREETQMKKVQMNRPPGSTESWLPPCWPLIDNQSSMRNNIKASLMEC